MKTKCKKRNKKYNFHFFKLSGSIDKNDLAKLV